MHFAKSTPAGDQAANGYADPAVVIPMLREIADQLTDIRDRLAGRTKSHYTVEEVAATTCRSPYTVRRWITDGRIQAQRVRGTGPKGRLLIPREELDKLI